MGTTKTNIFSDEINNLADIAKVIGHPARISIIKEIINKQSCICGDLVNEIGLAQPTISQHLKELKRIGIIKGTISGARTCYCIDEEKWLTIKNLFYNFFESLNNTPCCK